MRKEKTGKRKLSGKKLLITIVAIFSALILVVGSYVLYIVFSYDRVKDNLSLEVKGDAENLVKTNETLTLVTYNIGFGAYSPDYSFFMDGGDYARALSKDAVIENTTGAINTVIKQNPSFVCLQEVDVDGTRSYHVNQAEMIEERMAGFDSVFAQNYDSAYFLYPFNDPIGANNSGIMTFSKYNIESSIRRSLPIEESLYKYLDLDRAYSTSIIKTENGKNLVLYNVHLSAYTSDGTIADEQLKLLVNDMKEQYDKGNYVIAAGDFNKDLLIDSSKYFKRSEGEFTWAKPLDLSCLPPQFSCYSGENAPSCRNADSPYKGDGTDFVLSVDGALLSDNIEVINNETIDIGFEYSDHNPVKIEFILK